MVKIRQDLIGAVHAGKHVLFAGEVIPDGAKVGAWVTEGAASAAYNKGGALQSGRIEIRGEHGPELVQFQGKPEDQMHLFDPAEHSVPKVLAYLGTVSDAEAQRVFQAEAQGKARKGILNAHA